jgi:hypothetical protein
MAVTPSKTWEYSVNHVMSGASVTERNQKLWLRLKEMLTDTGSPGYLNVAGGVLGSLTKPWTVIASSDSVAADGTDRWSVIADIVGAVAGVAHSWMQLRQVDYFGSGDHLNLLLSCEDTTTLTVGYVAWARGALGWNADGTITNRPTPEAGVTVVQTRDGLVTTGDNEASDVMWGNDAINDNRVLQFRISDDGQCGGWWMFDSGVCTMLAGWQVDEGGPATSRVNPFHVWTGGKDAETEINVWALNWNTVPLIKTLDNADLEDEIEISIPVFGSSEDPMIESNIGADGSRFFGQILLRSLTQTTIFGVLTDQWWGSDANVSGDGAPLTPPVVWRAIGEMVIPWPSGTTMAVA